MCRRDHRQPSPENGKPSPMSNTTPRSPGPTRSRRRLPPRYAVVVAPLVLSIVMTCIVSAVATLKSLGPVPAALTVWPSAWAMSWFVAFPTLLAIQPLVRRLVHFIVEPARP